MTESEKELGMKPIWIELSAAISANDIYLEHNKDKDLWTSRELLVLRTLADNYDELNQLIEVSNSW